jgi:hypothetical protein
MNVDISDTAPTASPRVKMYAYDGGNNLIYEGWARPGSSTAAPVWAIKKYSYTGSNLTKEEWAPGNSSESKIWDNRASLTYV